jgi:hypothetical protein
MTDFESKINYCITQLEKFDSTTNGYVKHNIRMKVIKILKEIISQNIEKDKYINLEAYELGN